MEVFAVVVFESSLNMSYGVPFAVTIPVSIAGIELGLDTEEFFNEYLEFSGLGGYKVFLLVAVG